MQIETLLGRLSEHRVRDRASEVGRLFRGDFRRECRLRQLGDGANAEQIERVLVGFEKAALSCHGADSRRLALHRLQECFRRRDPLARELFENRRPVGLPHRDRQVVKQVAIQLLAALQRIFGELRFGDVLIDAVNQRRHARPRGHVIQRSNPSDCAVGANDPELPLLR